MKLEWFPEEIDPEVTGAVKKFLEKGLKKEKVLQAQVKAFLNKLNDLQDLQPLFNSEELAPLPKEKKGLYEMRIPPQRRGGVVRIYFCLALGKEDTLVLLDAELKKKKSGNYEKAKRNMKRYQEFKGRINGQ